jgi:hypothetical protein
MSAPGDYDKGEIGGMIGRGNRSTRRKPAPQTPHAARTRTRAAAVGSQRLTAELRHGLPRGLRHELSSPAQTLGSWVRIPLKAWMSVCVYSVFMLSCVQVAALRRAYPPSKESYRLCKNQETEKAAKIHQRTVKP